MTFVVSSSSILWLKARAGLPRKTLVEGAGRVRRFQPAPRAPRGCFCTGLCVVLRRKLADSGTRGAGHPSGCWIPFFPSLLSIGAWRGARRRGIRRCGFVCERRRAHLRERVAAYCSHLDGRTHPLVAANNYADSLRILKRFEETRTLLRKTIPVARRVLGEGRETTLRLRWNYAMALYPDAGATLDDIREAVTTLEEIERTARRVLGGAHPTTSAIERHLRFAREILCETPSEAAV